MNRNKKMYPFYRMFSYDYLFYFVISFLFFTITKGISIAQVMYLSGFAFIFMSLFEVPANYIVERIGLKKSTIIGNLMWICHILIIMFSTDFTMFVIAEAICAFGSSLKSLAETSLLTESIKEEEESAFEKIEGKGVAWYFYLEAAASLFVGSLFQVNNYLPLLFTLLFATISFIMSFAFDDITEYEHEKITLKESFLNIKTILKSKRIISIFAFSFIMSGLIAAVDTIQKSMITDLQVSEIEYSLIFAIATVFVGIGASFQYKIEKIFKRKTLTVSGYTFAILTLIMVFVNIFVPNKMLILSIAILILIIQNVVGGSYRISVEKYLNNFTELDIREKILSAFFIIRNIGVALFLFSTGFIIDNIGTNKTAIIIGTFGLIAMFFVVNYMKGKFGLNPEEYKKEEIFYYDVNKIMK